MGGHKEVEHGGLDHVQCSHCDKIFPCHQLLALHLYQEHGLVLRSSNDRGVKVALTEDDNLDHSETSLSHSENRGWERFFRLTITVVVNILGWRKYSLRSTMG